MTEAQFAEMLESDAAEIMRFDGGKMFLILHFNRRSEGEWLRNGEPYSFDYVERKAVASGCSMKELEASAREYKRLKGMSILDYIEECVRRQRAKGASE